MKNLISIRYDPTYAVAILAHCTGSKAWQCWSRCASTNEKAAFVSLCTTQAWFLCGVKFIMWPTSWQQPLPKQNWKHRMTRSSFASEIGTWSPQNWLMSVHERVRFTTCAKGTIWKSTSNQPSEGKREREARNWKTAAQHPLCCRVIQSIRS